jgi:hypothetical protein
MLNWCHEKYKYLHWINLLLLLIYVCLCSLIFAHLWGCFSYALHDAAALLSRVIAEEKAENIYFSVLPGFIFSRSLMTIDGFGLIIGIIEFLQIHAYK